MKRGMSLFVFFCLFFFLAFPIYAQKPLSFTLELLAQDNDAHIQYSLYEPVLGLYIQPDFSLSPDPFFQTNSQWNLENGLLFSQLPHSTIYTFVSQAKGYNDQVSDFSHPQSFVYSPCEDDIQDKPIYLYMDLKQNPPDTKYMIYIPETKTFVHPNGHFVDDELWFTTHELDKGKISIQEPGAHTYSFQIKARSNSGQETEFSAPARLSTCRQDADILVQANTYQQHTQILDQPQKKAALHMFYSALNATLFFFIFIAIILLIVCLRQRALIQSKKRPTKAMKAKEQQIASLLLYLLSFIAILFAIKLIYVLTMTFYTMRLQQSLDQISTMSDMPFLQSQMPGNIILYEVSLMNNADETYAGMMYQPIPKGYTYVLNSMSLNSKKNTDVIDADPLFFDATRQRIGISLKDFKSKERAVISFLLMKY